MKHCTHLVEEPDAVIQQVSQAILKRALRLGHEAQGGRQLVKPDVSQLLGPCSSSCI